MKRRDGFLFVFCLDYFCKTNKWKSLISFFILIILLSIISGLIEGITGDTVTGEASSTNLSIFVLPAIPALSILSPENKTYLSNESILLNYSVSNEDFVWYKIDSGNNITITSSIFINVTQGNHTLYLYANNSKGTTIKNVTFAANSTIFIILYSEYAGSNKGSSTDFNASTYEEIQNLSGVVLENTNSGKITFNEAINLTADSDFSDRVLDLDTNTNISFNRIELNSTALPNFDKSATLILYGLSFSNPRILRDGSVCSSSICTQNSYSGGDLSFNVTGFTIYSAEQTPSEEPPPPGNGGGGGGGVVTVTETIKLDKDVISITLKQGETKSEEVVISNVGTSTKRIDLIILDIQDFVKLIEESFDLNAGESKIIRLDFIAGENTLPDLYQGKLIVRSGNIEKEVLIAIGVEYRGFLFDISVEIPDSFLEVVPGEELLANIQLLRLGGERKVNVLLEYLIRDENGNSIVSDTQTISIETRASFVKKLKIPKDVNEGDYLLYVKATYNDQLASASAWFKVRQKFLFEKILSPLAIVLIVAIIIMIIILLLMRLLQELQKKEEFF